MKESMFTQEYYIDMCSRLLSVYQTFGHDLSNLLENIHKTNPIVTETFDKLYKKVKHNYVLKPVRKIAKFYEKFNSLIPDSEKLYTSLEVKALKRKHSNLALSEKRKLYRVDYLLASLCFMEEFCLLPLNDVALASNDILLSAHSENINIFVRQDPVTHITTIRIVIPGELQIEYCASANPL